MPFFRTVLSLSLFVCLAQADVLVMKNGDRVSGSVIKKDGDNVVIKTASFGVVTAPWKDVASREAAGELTVVTKGGATIKGPLTTPLPEVVAIRDQTEERAYERLQSPTWLQLWTGTVNLGLAGTQGNAKTQTFTTGFAAARTTNTDKTFMTLTAITSSATANRVQSETAKAIRAGIGYDHQLGDRFFLNTFNNYEYDKFQNLDLRFTAGGGLGYHVIDGKRRTLDLVGGASYDHASFNTPLVEQAAQFYWGDDFAQKIGKSTAIVQSYRMFNDLNNNHAYRFSFDVGANTKIGKWITWNLALNDRFQSDPAPGRKANDWMYTTGFGVTFGK